MWERGKPILRQRAVAAALAALLLAGSAPALAAPGSAQLEVRGPLRLDGPATAALDGAMLLLQDPGNPDYAGVTLLLHAAEARVTSIRVEELCADTPVPGPAPRTGYALPLPALPRPSPLRGAADALDQGAERAIATAQPLAPVPLPDLRQARSDPLAAAAPALAATEALAWEPRDAGQPLAGGTSRAAETFCATWHPGTAYDTFVLRNVSLAVRGLDPYYGLFWEGARARDAPDAARPGVVGLAAPSASLDVLFDGEELRLNPRDDDPFALHAPHRYARGGQLAVEAPEGRGTLAGDGELLVYRALAEVRGVRDDGSAFERPFRTGEQRERGLGGHERRVLQFLEVELGGAEGSFASPGSVRAFAPGAAMGLDGDLRMPEARGRVEVGNETFLLRGGAASLAGHLAFTAAPVEDVDGARRARDGEAPPTMTLALEGDVARVEGAGVLAEYPLQLAGTAAAVSAFALLAGALAYFWPTLKFAVAPLYTRIPTDALLAHGARETIYRLIKEEPGIHAHEVASRLDLGWGTAVYHLKLLERNGLVVAKREGRYKRFFATGDARLQHKDAVALLRNPTSRSIAGLVAERPGVIQKQVCEALGLSPSLASWHLQRLAAAGVVDAERLGRAVRYAPGPAWLSLQTMGPLTAAEAAKPVHGAPALAPP